MLSGIELGLAVGGGSALAALGLLRWLYVKVPANKAFIRTGLWGWKTVTESGAFVLPIVHHVQWLSLETFKIEVLREKRDACILKDRCRVDIGAEFYVKILPESAMIEAASRSLGDKSFSAEGVMELVGEKLVSALRSAAAQLELVELHENRRAFAATVKELVTEPLSQNGLGVEDVAIFHLDQTDKAHLDPSNVFDAEGLRRITEQTSARMRERNEIERDTEVHIKRKEVEAARVMLELEREQSSARAQQAREVENQRSESESESQRFRFEQELQTREAEIQKDQRIRELELASQVYLAEKERDRQLVDLERQRSIEEAEIGKAVALLQEERKRIAEQEEHLRAVAQREEAEQELISVARRAAVEREGELALLRAQKDVEVAEQRARAAEHAAATRLKEGQSQARVTELTRTAENKIEPKVIQHEVLLRLVERLPEIARELAEATREGRAGSAQPLLRDLLKLAQQRDLGESLAQLFPDVAGATPPRRSDAA